MGSLTERHVEDRIKEAVRTLKRLPEEKAKGYASLWPAIKRDAVEILSMEKRPFRLGPPQADEIDRMDEVLFVWLKWLEPEERKLVWMKCEKVPWKLICTQLGIGRTRAWERYSKALARMAAKAYN